MARNRSEVLPGRAEMLKYASAIERWLKDTSLRVGDSWHQIPPALQNEMDRHCFAGGDPVAMRSRRLAYIRKNYGT